MKTLILISSILLISITTEVFCQKSLGSSLGEPILTDSLSTLFIPVQYDAGILTSNKIALWNYYANIIVYDYNTDSYKKLFESDTFIKSFEINSNGRFGVLASRKPNELTSKWFFLLVKTKDTNNSGRIDEKDPNCLFAVSTDGKLLRQLTDEKENVVSIEAFEKQGFVLIRIQKDSDNDKSFKPEDKEYYLRKVSLDDLALGNVINL
jgi:hypothetical protein